MEDLMKQLIISEILKRFKASPRLKRKLKIFLTVAAVGFFVSSALLVWAGVGVVRYVAELAQNKNVSSQVESLETGLRHMPALTKIGCWDKAQSLIGVEPWLEKPIADNFRNLKVACLEAEDPICIGSECGASDPGLNGPKNSEAA